MILKEKSRRFLIADILLLGLAILPLVVGLVIKVLTAVPAEGISITGAQIYFTIPMPLQDLPITESQVTSLAVILFVTFFCLYLTHGVTKIPSSKRQIFAEFLVEKATDLVKSSPFGKILSYVLIISPFCGIIKYKCYYVIIIF